MMKKETVALVLNLFFFGGLFYLFKITIGTYMPMAYVPLIALSAVFASILSPKFLVQEGDLYVKFPLVRKPFKF